jgi:hypothetical protein
LLDRFLAPGNESDGARGMRDVAED